MSTAKKALYAAVGAGELALEQAKDLPKRVTTLPTQLRSSAGDLRDLPSKAISLPGEARQRVRKVVKTATTRLEKLTSKPRKRATKQFTDLSKRGEKLVKKVQRSAPTKRAVRKSAKAVEAVDSATETVVEQAG